MIQAFDFAVMMIVNMASFLTLLSLATLCYGAALPRAGDTTGFVRLPVSQTYKTGELANRQIQAGLANFEKGTIYVIDRKCDRSPSLLKYLTRLS